MHMRARLLIAGALAAVMATAASAGQMDVLMDKLVEYEVLAPGEARSILTEAKESERADLAMGGSTGSPAWVQNLSFKGDLRLRHQTDWSQGAVTRNRERLRLRIGAVTRASEKLGGAFGLATAAMKMSGSDVLDKESRSTNHTFGDTFSKAPVMIDYAYLQYEPLTWLTLTGGKMKNPVWNTTDLLWDGDLNPDGVAAPVKFDLVPEKTTLFIAPAAFILDEISGDPSDPMLYVIQPGISWKASDEVSLKAAVAWYMPNVKGKKLDLSAGTNAGAATALTNEFNTINPSVQIGLSNVLGYSLALFGDYATNTSTSTNNAGYAAGLKFGHAKVSGWGTWQVKYIQRYLEQEAFLDTFPDSDAYGGATNAKGSEAILELGLTRSASLGIDYYSMDKILGASAPRSLVQFDIVYKF